MLQIYTHEDTYIWFILIRYMSHRYIQLKGKLKLRTLTYFLLRRFACRLNMNALHRKTNKNISSLSIEQLYDLFGKIIMNLFWKL